MDNHEKLALERVMKARSEIIFDHTFYGVAVSNVDPQISRRVPTAATNGKTHYWNPDYVAMLDQDELVTVQQHESEHDVRRHHSRRGDRDPEEWNIATDLAINVDLVDQGRKLRPEWLLDPKYRGWSAEDIYRARELDRKKAEQEKREQEKGESPEAGEDESEDGLENADTDPGHNDDEGDETEGSNADGDETDGETEGQPGGNADGEGDDEGDGQGEGAGEPADEADDGAGSQGKGNGKAEGQGPSNGQGEGEAEGQAEGKGASDGEDAEDAGQLEGSADPGGMGAVLDAGEDVAELSDADGKWERVLRQAASLAAKRGTAPGHVSREIERADKPPQDWRETLRAWFDHGATTTETWARPNRRFIGGGLYLPGRQRDGINRVAFLIDTSGSMDDIALACIAKETQAALDEGIIDEVVIVYGDTRVTRVDTYRNGDEIEFDPRGGGGTELWPMFEYVRDNVEDPTLLVVFTDGYIDAVAAKGEPPAQVLWAYTGYPDVVRDMIATAPWGAPAIDVGSH